MTELQGPSTFELKKFISGNKVISFYLLNDKIITGNLIWHDNTCFHVKDENGKEITILKSAIAFYSAIK